VAAASSPNPSSFSPGVGGEREKAAIAAHPLYERLLEAHVATPVYQHPRIDAQIVACPPRSSPRPRGGPSGGEELDLFMVRPDPPYRLLPIPPALQLCAAVELL
jgi:hypothetical protein